MLQKIGEIRVKINLNSSVFNDNLTFFWNLFNGAPLLMVLIHPLADCHSKATIID